MEVNHAEEQEDMKEEEILDQLINTHDIPSTANLSNQDEPTNLLLVNRNNNR